MALDIRGLPGMGLQKPDIWIQAFSSIFLHVSYNGFGSHYQILLVGTSVGASMGVGVGYLHSKPLGGNND